MLKTEVKLKDAKVTPRRGSSIQGVEGAHELVHPITGEPVLVISADHLKTRVRVWVTAMARYPEFSAEDGYWSRPQDELRAQADEMLVIFNNVPVTMT